MSIDKRHRGEVKLNKVYFWKVKEYQTRLSLKCQTPVKVQPKIFSQKKKFAFEIFCCCSFLWHGTPNSLNSVNSPWKVYVSNFRLLVHPLMQDFGGGSFSSCCCSDRGKTKSTPSSKTEVGTLDWGLTKIISKFW